MVKGKPSSKIARGGPWAVVDLTVLFAIVITRPPLAVAVNSFVAYASCAACPADGRQD